MKLAIEIGPIAPDTLRQTVEWVQFAHWKIAKIAILAAHKVPEFLTRSKARLLSSSPKTLGVLEHRCAINVYVCEELHHIGALRRP